ncbi:trimeric intracellular cation channel family protein [Segetibacter sp. 3557_3]|uniref:trimeric intracellular cation channel family protein n=1 Tax=Segetibacter sp. 3557_3 TaxID=2547429 RepID=UPI001058EA41|nr:trimeric intracellular cation channel family protein [Segetibacter sp. 3557_3]TDH25239.1 trimeric intracellular cation channel family protein [Segetibacter sp. 3557_3]
MTYELLKLIDVLGTVLFAISGVFAAMQKRLDVFGILIIAFITAIGGGTLRDMMIGDFPVSWIRNINYSIIILVSSVIAMVFNKTIRNLHRTLLVFDSLGLGFFTVLGIQKALAFGLHPGICVAIGMVTGCFGGVIRDIALNNIPLIFQKEIYATACITGGVVYFLLLKTGLQRDWLEVICIGGIFAIRMIAVHYRLALPGIDGAKREKSGET